MHIKTILKSTFIFLLMSFTLSGNAKTISEELHWTDVQSLKVNGGEIKTLSFTDADNAEPWGLLPVYSRRFELPPAGLIYDFELTNLQFSKFDIQDQSEIADIDLISESVNFTTTAITIRGKHYIQFKMLPLRNHPANGQIEKLMAFDLNYQLQPGDNYNFKDGSNIYAENSVLATGDWYKISVSEDGIYKVSWQNLSDMGMNMSGLESEKIQLFGNGGGMLPQKNRDFRHDDLIENAIQIEDGNDGSFDSGDYFLFYGQSPHTWGFHQSVQVFEHAMNKFTNENYYFITFGSEPGKRIDELETSSIPAEKIYTTFNDYAAHELDAKSLIKSGQEWYGEEFNDVLTHDFAFPFPNRDVSEGIHIDADVAARSTLSSSFSVFVNNDSVFTDNVSAISQNSITKYANPSSKSNWYMNATTSDLNLTLKYNRRDEKSMGWLNYITLNITSHLQYNGSQFAFRNINAFGEDEIGEFRIANANNNLKVWNITSRFTPENIQINIADEIGSFALQMDSIYEFIAFDGSDFMQAEFIGYIPNQNLHAHKTADFIIVSHPDFIDQAERLANLHRELDGMDVIVINIFDIYNEFSSGAPDVTAIRDFVRMVYQKSGTPPALKYLLLFGDGSYDYLNRIESNLSFVPVFQSKQSLWFTSTFVTDDYFGLMDISEGNDASGNIDLGIGRFAVNTHEEAQLMVDKVESYMRMDPSVQGKWRNNLTFVADDEDNNLHFFQADTILVARIQKENTSVNFNKIYFDSYAQQSSASGDSYPDATADFNKAVNQGSLIVNYTGHGGELGLAHEKVVQISDILSWNNKDALSVFVTATCEFSRFDNPALTSAGELVLLNKNGGGIALFTTTRLAFASANLLLNKRLYDTLFRAYPQTHPRLGDLMMFSKIPSNTNLRNFVLLGNPALKLALPGYNVITDSINGIPAELFNDTINASGQLTISGHIESYYDIGETVKDFNGTIYPTLFDKPTVVTTLGNDPKSFPYNFDAQNSVLYEGKASVKEGRFNFSLVLPLDISYQFGDGKLSYYAADSLKDAGGCYSGIVIGGNSDGTMVDNSGPEIGIYLNEINSAIPEQVNANPILYIELSDPSGINHLGTGIGHDIVLSMEGDTYDSYILNDKFEPTLDDYTSGNIVYQIENLPKGNYMLELKAWDVANNSSSKTINFMVSDNIDVDLLEVYNYPNPFSDYTSFTFRHNQFEGELDVEIDIYNFYGQIVRTIGPEKVFTNAYSIDPIVWKGDSEGGNKLGAGCYFYAIRVSNQEDQSSERIQKLIITE